ncbi:ThiF family adenylyltransferase, partial [Staphylococcus hominis]|uniref:ThiF family adenylyltransferase n=1 Tax=Staphylococcus hominis TaxID=1290 RepID=UPI0021B51170
WNGRILIVGGGGLGSEVGEVLGGMGGDDLGIVDMDMVELCNLDGQGVYSEDDGDDMVGKVEGVKEKIEEIN